MRVDIYHSALIWINVHTIDYLILFITQGDLKSGRKNRDLHLVSDGLVRTYTPDNIDA